MILLGLFSLRASRILGPISRFRVAESLPHMKLASCASRPGLTVVVFYASFAMDFVRHIDFTLRERHRCVEFVARMNPTLSHTTTNVLSCTICLPLFGGMRRHYHGEVIFFMTWSLKFSNEVSNMGSL